MFVEGCLIRGLVVIRVICIVLVLGVGSFFIIGVLVGRSGIGDRMLGFIGR